jgi:hypothetical protein
MPKVCHSSESWNPEVIDFKGTGFPIKNFGNELPNQNVKQKNKKFKQPSLVPPSQ